jgi:glycerophosphoryl diester phosphodiesterase
VLTSLTQPVIFAHRGASAHAPENTLAAFELALEQGTDAIELDAKLSADGHVVVIHDATVDRTT